MHLLVQILRAAGKSPYAEPKESGVAKSRTSASTFPCDWLACTSETSLFVLLVVKLCLMKMSCVVDLQRFQAHCLHSASWAPVEWVASLEAGSFGGTDTSLGAQDAYPLDDPVVGRFLMRWLSVGTPHLMHMCLATADEVLEGVGARAHLLSHATEGYFVPVDMEKGPLFDSSVRSCCADVRPRAPTDFGLCAVALGNNTWWLGWVKPGSAARANRYEPQAWNRVREEV